MQLLLFPDPRPLVERLGAEFFRTLPECAGVYLMCDRANTVLYVGKAKNLRKRLAHYRVANPDRLPRRHLRLLRAVERIELEPCADEAAALAREAELLKSIRPRFNRAGTWQGSALFLTWRRDGTALEFAITETPEEPWLQYGPRGSVLRQLRAVLVRLLWSAVRSPAPISDMPAGWCHGLIPKLTRLDCRDLAGEAFSHVAWLLAGDVTAFRDWVTARRGISRHPFEREVMAEDLEALGEMLGQFEITLQSSSPEIENRQSVALP